jgi:DNA-binding NtrC family response regulator
VGNAVPAPSDVPPDASDRALSVLVVEDEVLIRMSISDYLQDCGFKTFEAGSASDAMEILSAGLWHIDVVFSDIQLHGVTDGIGLAKWIAINKPETRVILCSGDHTKAKQAAELCKNEPFFSKPYSFEKVAAQIRLLAARDRT